MFGLVLVALCLCDIGLVIHSDATDDTSMLVASLLLTQGVTVRRYNVDESGAELPQIMESDGPSYDVIAVVLDDVASLAPQLQPLLFVHLNYSTWHQRGVPELGLRPRGLIIVTNKKSEALKQLLADFNIDITTKIPEGSVVSLLDELPSILAPQISLEPLELESDGLCVYQRTTDKMKDKLFTLPLFSAPIAPGSTTRCNVGIASQGMHNNSRLLLVGTTEVLKGPNIPVLERLVTWAAHRSGTFRVREAVVSSSDGERPNVNNDLCFSASVETYDAQEHAWKPIDGDIAAYTTVEFEFKQNYERLPVSLDSDGIHACFYKFPDGTRPYGVYRIALRHERPMWERSELELYETVYPDFSHAVPWQMCLCCTIGLLIVLIVSIMMRY